MVGTDEEVMVDEEEMGDLLLRSIICSLAPTVMVLGLYEAWGLLVGVFTRDSVSVLAVSMDTK